MGNTYSVREAVKQNDTSKQILSIVVEDGVEQIPARVQENLVDWLKSNPNTSPSYSTTEHSSLEEAEAYACELYDAKLKEGFVPGV